MKQLYLVLIALGFALLPKNVSAQTVIYSNSVTGNDATGDGSAGNPYKSFTKAYTMANSGNIIDLTGTFTWTDAAETDDVANSGFTINKNLTIRGQSAASTIVQAASTINTADRAVFWVRDATVTIKNLTIRYGKNTATSGMDCYGGGITAGYNSASSSKNTTLTLDNCRITDNYSTAAGGFYRGGGFSCMSSQVTITNCDISNNTGSINYYGAGGLYFVRSFGVTIRNTSITKNSGTRVSATTNDYSTVAGAINYFNTYSGALVMSNLTISENTVTGGYGTVTLGTLISSGAIITNCTIANNTSVSNVYSGIVRYGGNGDINIKNTIVAQNSSSAGSPVDFYMNGGSSNVYDNGYNMIGSSSGFTSWGGTTQTGSLSGLNLSSTAAANSSLNSSLTLALSSGSIAINAGNGTANSTESIPGTDSRGLGRSGTVDIGAYEYGGIVPVATWNGTNSGDWNTASNWSGSSLPGDGYNITFSATAANDLQMDKDHQVNTVNFNGSGKKLLTGNYTLTATAISGAGANSYISTNGTGKLSITVSNSATVNFPVGNSAYNPLGITNNTGSADDFSVYVLDEVYQNGSSGATMPGPRVKRTWNISKTTANGGSGVDLNFNWNSGESVWLNVPAMYHFDGSNWVQQSGTTSSGTNSFTFQGYTGNFSPFAVGDLNSTLPVSGLQLQAFADKKAVVLNWSVDAEWGTKAYEVEHSTNGNSWTRIGQVSAASQASGTGTHTAYQYRHENPAEAINYYRLKIVDVDGLSRYSKTVSVNVANANAGILAYPNPVQQGVLNLSISKPGTVRIFNSNGAMIWQQQLPAGVHPVSTKNWARGIYRLEFAGRLTSLIVQ